MCGGGKSKSPAPAPVAAKPKPIPQPYTNDNGVVRGGGTIDPAQQQASFGSELGS